MPVAACRAGQVPGHRHRPPGRRRHRPGLPAGSAGAPDPPFGWRRRPARRPRGTAAVTGRRPRWRGRSAARSWPSGCGPGGWPWSRWPGPRAWSWPAGRRAMTPWRPTTRGTGELIVAAARALGDLGPGRRPGSGDRRPGRFGDHRRRTRAPSGRSRRPAGSGRSSWWGRATSMSASSRRSPGSPGRRAPPTSRWPSSPPASILIADLYRRDYGLDVAKVAGAGAAGGLGRGHRRARRKPPVGVRRGHRTARLPPGAGGQLAGRHRARGPSMPPRSRGRRWGRWCATPSAAGVPSLVIAGQATDEAVETATRHGSRVVSLTRRFGEERARSDTARCIAAAVAEYFESAGSGPAACPAVAGVSRRPSSRGSRRRR